MKVRGVQAFHAALLAHRDRVRVGYEPTDEELLSAFGVASDDDSWENVWNLDADDVTAMWERLGPRDAVPYLRAVWDTYTDFNDNARSRALSYLLSPKSIPLNPIVPFLMDLDQYGVLPLDWVLDPVNREGLRTVWIYSRVRDRNRDVGLGIYLMHADALHTVLMRDYVTHGRHINVDALDAKCTLIREYTHPAAVHYEEVAGLMDDVYDDFCTLTAAGIPAWYARYEMREGYDYDGRNLPIVPPFDTHAVAAEWVRFLAADVPVPLVHALRGETPVDEALDALDTFRVLNAEGAFPFALVATALGVDDDTLTDDEWNDYCIPTQADAV